MRGSGRALDAVAAVKMSIGHRDAGHATVCNSFGAGISEELTMTKSILAITIVALTSSGALAAHHRTHHHQAMNASPAVGAPPPMMGASPMMGNVNSSDHTDHVKSLRESGYNPKNDFNPNGTIKTQ